VLTGTSLRDQPKLFMLSRKDDEAILAVEDGVLLVARLFVGVVEGRDVQQHMTARLMNGSGNGVA